MHTVIAQRMFFSQNHLLELGCLNMLEHYEFLVGSFNPSEKLGSIGMMKFPIYGKIIQSCSSHLQPGNGPPNQICRPRRWRDIGRRSFQALGERGDEFRLLLLQHGIIADAFGRSDGRIPLRFNEQGLGCESQS